MFCTLRKYFLERSVDIILKASIPKLREKLLEALQAVLPIVAIVLVLCFSIAPVSPSILLCFLLGAAMIIVGIMFFTLGAEMSMSPMGERVGAMLTKSRSVPLIIGVGFLLGFLITISEPDLQVLANQVPSIPNMTLILSVAAGVGLFLVVAFLRMLLGIALPKLLVVFYGLIFVLAAFVPKEFLSVAFDSGGVTTGPITVPFIMALGVGVAAIRSDRHAADDSFGLVALCSIGPILAVLILGIAFQASDSTYVPPILPNVSDSVELWQLFHEGLPTYIKEIATSLLPIIAMFGGTVNGETFRHSQEYFFYISLGIPFYMFGQAMNPVIRADGNPRFAMISTLAGAVLNIILDPIFIFECKWGMMGAAVATVLGQIVTAALAVWYLCRMKTVKPGKGDFRLHASLCTRMLTLGITSFLSQISLVAAMAAINNMLRKYGALDEIFSQKQYAQIPMAVVGIVMKFFQIVISIVVGMAAGCIPIVGYNMGAEKKTRVRKLFTMLLIAETLVGAASLILAEGFPRQLIAVFGAANESSCYADFAVKAFRTYLCMMVLACINKACFIFLQSVCRPVRRS